MNDYSLEELKEKYNNLKKDYNILKTAYEDFKKNIISKLENMKREEYDDRDESYNVGIEHSITTVQEVLDNYEVIGNESK